MGAQVSVAHQLGANHVVSQLVSCCRAIYVPAALIISDIVAIGAGVAASRMITSHWLGAHDLLAVSATHGLAPLGRSFMVDVLLVYLFFLGRGHYTRHLPFWTEAREIAEGCSYAVFTILALDLCLGTALSPAPILSSWALFPIIALASRQSVRHLLAWAGLWQVPVVIVGDAAGIKASLASFDSAKLPKFHVMGVVSIDGWQPTRPTERWSAVLQQSGATRIVFACSLNCQRDWTVVETFVQQRVPFSTFSSMCGLPISGADHLSSIGQHGVLINFRNKLAQPAARLTKGCFDFMIAGTLVLALSPLLLLIASVVAMDGGPVFFSHKRIGRSGKTFHCLKFRTMSVNAHEILRTLLDTDDQIRQEWEATQKLRHDPRVTWIGRVLRTTSLDELPQLLNVIRMEMSLVGPRPIVQLEESRYGDRMSFYHETRPGLTGLWQVSGRSATSYSRRVQLDTWYVSNWSVWLDVAILARTIPAVLKRDGAH